MSILVSQISELKPVLTYKPNQYIISNNWSDH